LKNIVILISGILSLGLVSCENPTGIIALPPSPPSLQDETASIPWSKLTGKIAYVRAVNSGFYPTRRMVLIDAEKQRLVEIRKLDPGVRQATVSADGRTLAYVRNVNQSSYYYQAGIFKADTGNGSETTVYSNQSFSGAGPSWSKDGRLAYFASGLSSGGTLQYHGVVYIENAIFYQGLACSSTRPAWSPDGTFMVVVAYYEVNYQTQPVLLKILLSQGNTQPVVVGNFSDTFSDPVISRDGQRLAFVRRSYSDTAASGIWTINVDGSDPTRVTNDERDRYPCFSPDGAKIVFERPTNYWTDSEGSIYLINANGTDLTLVTPNGGSWPTWID